MSFRHSHPVSSFSQRPGWLTGPLATLFLTAAILLKLWLVSGQHLTALGDAGHDDRLFLTLAESILAGQWLGPYNNLTLAKGPLYPLWVAAVSYLGIPLLLAQHLLYIMACIIAAVALKPLIPAWLPRYVIFLFVLFNPMSFTGSVMAHVVREGIYPALTLLVIGSAAGFLLRLDRAVTTQLPWAAGLGLSLAALWLTREEGVWIVPPLLLLALFGTVKIVRDGRCIPGKLLPLLIPFIIWSVCVTGICMLNKVYYGIYGTTEMKSPDFLDAYGSLARVNPARWEPTVPVQREVRNRVYDVSPAFSELRPHLEGGIGRTWSGMFRTIREFAARDPVFAEKIRPYLSVDPEGIWDRAMGDDREIHGGFFLWALRDAVAAAGHHRSGQSAAAFYRRIADEVNNACGAGTLDCGPGRSSFAPPFRLWYLTPALTTMGEGAMYLAKLEGFDVNPEPSHGDESLLRPFREITRERLTPARYRIQGRVAGPPAPIVITLRTAGGVPVQSVPLRSEKTVSPGLPSSGERDLPSAPVPFDVTGNLFSLSGIFHATWLLSVESGGAIIGKIPLDGSVKQFRGGGIEVFLDSAGPVSGPSEADILKLRRLDGIASFYRILLPIAAILSLGLYFFATFRTVKRRRMTAAWIISTALVVSIVARLVILSLVHVTSFPAVSPRYLSPAYPLLLIFIVVSLVDGTATMRGRDGSEWSSRG